jgi:hypothetical protein
MQRRLLLAFVCDLMHATKVLTVYWDATYFHPLPIYGTSGRIFAVLAKCAVRKNKIREIMLVTKYIYYEFIQYRI